MSEFFIESINCDALTDEIGCCGGPDDGTVAAEIKVRDEKGKISYYSLAEVYGIPNWYCTEESALKRLLEYFDNEEVLRETAKYLAENSLDLGESYDDIYADEDAPNYRLYKLLIAIVRLDFDEMDALIKAAEGKYLDDVEIPICDMEDEWIFFTMEIDGEEEEEEE